MGNTTATDFESCIEEKIKNSWSSITDCLKKISSNTSIFPRQMYIDTHFKIYETEYGIEVLVNPIILTVPDGSKSNNLHILIEGLLLFDKTLTKHNLKIIKYSTNMNIYREKNNELNQIYGVHYDYVNNNIDHPKFHAQFSDNNKIDVKILNSQTRIYNIKKFNSTNIYGGSRIPTAQLDIFSTFVHLCADHLLPEDINSNTDGYNKKILENFERLKNICLKIQCADSTMPIKLWYTE